MRALTNAKEIGCIVSLASAFLVAGGCANMNATTPAPASAAGALPAERIAQIIASPDRSAADRNNDIRRKPDQMLAFIGVRPGMVALDVSAGGGYTTELLARAIGPAGRVYGQAQPRDPNRAPPVAPEGGSVPSASASAPASAPAAAVRTSAMALAERSDRLRSANVAAAPIMALAR